MGIGRNLSERKGRELRELREETNTTTNKSRKNRRHRLRKMSPGQRLFQTCNEVFASTGPGIVPSPQHIEMLLSVLGMECSHHICKFCIIFCGISNIIEHEISI